MKGFIFLEELIININHIIYVTNDNSQNIISLINGVDIVVELSVKEINDLIKKAI